MTSLQWLWLFHSKRQVMLQWSSWTAALDCDGNVCCRSECCSTFSLVFKLIEMLHEEKLHN